MDTNELRLEVFIVKKLLEEVQQQQKPPSIFNKVSKRVQAIAEAHNEGDKFIYQAMELIQERNAMKYFIAIQTDETSFEYSSTKLYGKGVTFFF